jgi:Divergent CRAL/TRIO domain
MRRKQYSQYQSIVADDNIEIIVHPSLSSSSSDVSSRSQSSSVSSSSVLLSPIEATLHGTTIVLEPNSSKYDVTAPMPVPMESVPDIYGQLHPIESHDLIKWALYEFEKQLRLLPNQLTHDALLAEKNCSSNMISIQTRQGRNFKLGFIRAEVYRCDDAATRYAKYWTKRIELFGSNRAFQPITMSTLTPHERAMVQSQHIVILPSPHNVKIGNDDANVNDSDKHNNNNSMTTNKETRITSGIESIVDEEKRNILYVDYGNFVPETMSNDDFIRAMWYILHSLGDDCIETQKHGVVYIANSERSSRSKWPKNKFLIKFFDSFKQCAPVRVSAYHVIFPPTIVKTLYPLVSSLVLNERLRKRVVIHTQLTNYTDIITTFQSTYGISSQQIPTSIGGSYQIDIDDWIQKQLLNGK